MTTAHPLVSVIVLYYKNRAFLESIVKTAEGLTYPNLEYIFVDNHSQDDAVEWLNKNATQSWRILPEQKNSGYAGGMNAGIRASRGTLIFLLNPDLILEPDVLTKLMHRMHADPRLAAVGPKLLKYDFETHQKTKMIDTVGIACYRNRRFIDEGQGLKDDGRYDHHREVFGVSGACVLLRRTALEDVAYKGQYFDEDFFMYKEDVDLAWRLRLAGWTCAIDGTAVSYHGRGTGVLKRFTHWEVMKNRRHLPAFTKGLSYRNQRIMQLKNEMWRTFLPDALPILWRELLAFGYVLLREPFLLSKAVQVLTQLPKTIRKRHFVLQKAQQRKIEPQKIRKWLKKAPSTSLNDHA